MSRSTNIDDSDIVPQEIYHEASPDTISPEVQVVTSLLPTNDSDDHRTDTMWIPLQSSTMSNHNNNHINHSSGVSSHIIIDLN